MQPDRFVAELKQGNLPRVIALAGPERVYVDEALAIIRERALAGGLADFNHDRISAKEHNADDAVHLANTFPTMAPCRLVEVADAERLELTPLLDRYLDHPAKECVLVLLFSTFDARKKLSKTIRKKTHLGKFDHPKDREMVGIARARAKRHGLSLTGDAAELLAFTTGPDLQMLERALEKLTLAAAGNTDISSELVSAHVADTHALDAFVLGRAVAEADRKLAVSTLAALEAARSEPIQLMGLLAWQLRTVLRAAAILDEGGNTERVRSELRLFGDRQRSTLAAARRFSVAQHIRRLLRVGEVDGKIKSSSSKPWLLLHRLVLELCPAQQKR